MTEQKNNQTQYRDEIENQNLEFQVFHLPINEDEILNKLGTKLKHAKVVFDASSIGSEIVLKAQNIYDKALAKHRYSSDARKGTKAYLNSVISGMKDNIDNSAMSTKKFGAFYPRIVNVWNQFVDKTYSENLYISLPYIKSKDNEFFQGLEILYAYNTKPKDRIEIAEKLVKHVFKD